jgi:hypothetical protein
MLASGKAKVWLNEIFGKRGFVWLIKFELLELGV